MITAEKIKCYHCSDELEGEDAESPMRDSAGNPYCERCYRDEIEGECDRCGEYVEQDKEHRPSCWRSALKPAITALKIYMDGIDRRASNRLRPHHESPMVRATGRQGPTGSG
jgi:hypothetical protein